jgi:hypothetical protein
MLSSLEVICAYLPYNCWWEVEDELGNKIKGKIRRLSVTKEKYVKLDLMNRYKYRLPNGVIAETYDPKVSFDKCKPVLYELSHNDVRIFDPKFLLRRDHIATGLRQEQYIPKKD